MQVCQPGRGLDAEFGDQAGSQPPVDVKRFGLPSGAVQRMHQLPVHGLPPRMLPQQRLSTFGNNVSNLNQVLTIDCGAPGFQSVSWIDSSVGSAWLEHPDVDTSLCLTAYKDHSVYFEHCKANDTYERWREIHVGTIWHLQNAATGEYLRGGGNRQQVYTNAAPQAWS